MDTFTKNGTVKIFGADLNNATKFFLGKPGEITAFKLRTDKDGNPRQANGKDVYRVPVQAVDSNGKEIFGVYLYVEECPQSIKFGEFFYLDGEWSVAPFIVQGRGKPKINYSLIAKRLVRADEVERRLSLELMPNA